MPVVSPIPLDLGVYSVRFETLEEWLSWQERLHPKAVDLGLDRVREVWQRLHPGPPPCPVVTIAGTNGKGSCAAMLEAILLAAAYRTGCYSSPHLIRYNERIRIDGKPATDAEICAAFQRVDTTRGTVSLTYFEFATLAALDLFVRSAAEVIILEVGLGGRLDAVNVVDADVALIATVDLDHTEWLGDDVASIAREKAGILRRGRPAICADPEALALLSEHAQAAGAVLYCAGSDYRYEAHADTWTWRGPQNSRYALPLPNLRGRFQVQNAAAVLMAIEILGAGQLPVAQSAVRQGLQEVSLPARFQVFQGAVPVIVDVAHNPQAAQELAANLQRFACPGKVHAVTGILADKDARQILAALAPAIDTWHLVELAGPRSRPPKELEALVAALAAGSPVAGYASPALALSGAKQRAQEGDCILVFGSFLVAGEVLQVLEAGA